MRKEIVRITTADTKKTYELPGEDVPQLWEAVLTLTKLQTCGTPTTYGHLAKTVVYLEKATLVKAGLTPNRGDEKPTEPPQETTEDLCLRLLEHLGFYPAE